MIADLLPTRLYWVGLRGVALEAMDYAPGEVATVMPRREGWRDMTPAEIAAARRLLEQLTAQGSPA